MSSKTIEYLTSQNYKWVKVTITEVCRVPENYDKEQCSTHLIENLYEQGGWPGVDVKLLPEEEALELESDYRKLESALKLNVKNIREKLYGEE